MSNETLILEKLSQIEQKLQEQIKKDDEKTTIANIHYFLKDYLEPLNVDLPIKALLEKYKEEVTEVGSVDKDVTDLFGHCNAWWVFGEVSKNSTEDIFMAEADNVGYKRGKGKIKPMPNDLFDIEAAPKYLDTAKVQTHFKEIVQVIELAIDETEKSITTLKKKIDAKTGKGDNTEKTDLELEKEVKKLKRLQSELLRANDNLKNAQDWCPKYYQNDYLKEAFFERTDKDLRDLFTTGIFKLWKSEDVALRKTEAIKILDHFRQSVIWD